MLISPSNTLHMMDTFSCNSSPQNLVPFDHDHEYHDDYDRDQDQQSGWTTYLEDFSKHRRGIDDRDQDDHMSSCSVLGPSLVSDAATGAAVGRKGGHHVACCSDLVAGSVSFPNKLKFRKARSKKIREDDSLEDTASSPVNSPKVSHDEQIQVTPRKIDDYISSSYVMGKGHVQDQIQEVDDDDDDERSINNSRDDKNDLRSRGLCLVPISMFVNHNP